MQILYLKSDARKIFFFHPGSASRVSRAQISKYTPKNHPPSYLGVTRASPRQGRALRLRCRSAPPAEMRVKQMRPTEKNNFLGSHGKLRQVPTSC